jgi:hypothetical protein
MHERIRRAIGTGFGAGEWQLLSRSHPVARLYAARKHADGDRLLREYTAAHEAGHAVMARLIGVDVQRVVVAHLHEVDAMTGGGTLGFNEYRVRGDLEPTTELLLNLGGIAGHETVYNNGWGLDAGAWTPAGALDDLRGEGVAGGDLWEARECAKREILAGRRVLGRSTTADALEAGFAQAEGLLLGARGRLLALAGHLLAYGQADRADIEGIWTRGE